MNIMLTIGTPVRRTIFGCTFISFLLMSSVHGQTERIDLSLDNERPVAEAIKLLVTRHPVVITYEDPRYEYEGDIKDVTEIARNPINSDKPGRVLVPMGGSLNVSYEVALETNEPVDPADTLRRILEYHHNGASGGRFRVESSGRAFHVVPTEARDSRGQWVGQASILDVPITLPCQEMRGDDCPLVVAPTLVASSTRRTRSWRSSACGASS